MAEQNLLVNLQNQQYKKIFLKAKRIPEKNDKQVHSYIEKLDKEYEQSIEDGFFICLIGV
ncbi:MAG: hypothetical protein L6U99_08620 [Clostridium sp.]|nr:MAG: hypothetical protein L6U99_08620 [Clostridium sp.]